MSASLVTTDDQTAAPECQCAVRRCEIKAVIIGWQPRHIQLRCGVSYGMMSKQVVKLMS